MELGWIGSLVVGGFAGWFASRFMNADSSVIVNVILGIVGAAVAGFAFGIAGIDANGVFGYLIAGFIGAAILIAAQRKFF